jgi:hypothetical protein
LKLLSLPDSRHSPLDFLAEIYHLRSLGTSPLSSGHGQSVVPILRGRLFRALRVKLSPYRDILSDREHPESAAAESWLSRLAF